MIQISLNLKDSYKVLILQQNFSHNNDNITHLSERLPSLYVNFLGQNQFKKLNKSKSANRNTLNLIFF